MCGFASLELDQRDVHFQLRTTAHLGELNDGSGDDSSTSVFMHGAKKVDPDSASCGGAFREIGILLPVAGVKQECRLFS